MAEIKSFFRVVIARFFARDPQCKELADIAAGIFDWERTLHQKALASHSEGEAGQLDCRASWATKRAENEMNWRLHELKVGDQVDVVKHAQVRDLTVSAWSRGTVIFKGPPQDEESTDAVMRDSTTASLGAQTTSSQGSQPSPGIKLDIRYENDRDALVKRFDLMDHRIAPVGTYTDDFDWRYSLKDGDHIDCMDNEKEWYKSTILGTRLSPNPAGESVPEIYVAFRTHSPEGSKQDEDGRRFFGWSDRYDEWYAVTDVQVQRFGACHLQYRKVEAQNKVYRRSGEFDDREDTLYSTKRVAAHATPRERFFAGSLVMTDALNRFAEEGGYRKIIDMIKSASQGAMQLSLQHLVSLMSFLSRTQPLWHR